MNYRRIVFALCFVALFANTALPSTIKRVLFIGNSYTDVNNLPLLVSQVAASNGDSVYYDSNVPGGMNLYGHSINAITLSKIAQGNWDYVVIQAQSQEPSFSPSQVANGVLPYARKLDSLVHAADSCAQTIFYMTWGRKNGDTFNCAAYPPVCTYAGMQARLRSSYLLMAQQNNASVAPVGMVWRELINQNTTFDLYQNDESHPSIYGSYAAACVFYASFFHTKVKGNYVPAGVATAEALLIQQQSNKTVFDSLSNWYSSGNIPFSNFTYLQHGDSLQFTNTSINTSSVNWDFGDGTNSNLLNPEHVYSGIGVYPVKLTATNMCHDTASFTDTIIVTTAGLRDETKNDNWQISYNNLLQEITISGVQGNHHNKLKIFDEGGKLVLQTAMSSRVKVALSIGVYIVGIYAKDNQLGTPQKIVIY
jgi:PKD repeat protein